MATSQNTHNQGAVKDPEHDGRLKENREAGKTKGTTEASAARSGGHAQEVSHGKSTGHKAEPHQASEPAAKSGESDDLKSREYTDAQGNVHHHTTKHG